MLKRLKYVSRFSGSLSRSEIDDIVERAVQNNRTLGITGMMMASGGIFFQVLEGPSQAVDTLYEKIASDPRHTDMVCESCKVGSPNIVHSVERAGNQSGIHRRSRQSENCARTWLAALDSQCDSSFIDARRCENDGMGH